MNPYNDPTIQPVDYTNTDFGQEFLNRARETAHDIIADCIDDSEQYDSDMVDRVCKDFVNRLLDMFPLSSDERAS